MMRLRLQRRLTPAESPLALAAFALAGLLFLPCGESPLAAYGFLLGEAFGSWHGFGFTLVQATPLILVAQGTIVAWRAGLGYVGFEGCFVVGAAAAAVLSAGAGRQLRRRRGPG